MTETTKEPKLISLSEIAFRMALRHGPPGMADAEPRELFRKIAPPLQALVRTYDPARDGGRLVVGATGEGKSAAAVLVLRRLAPAAGKLMLADATRKALLWVRAHDLPRAVLEHGLGQGSAPLVEDATRADFLVLDDLGWESNRAGADDALLEVISTRYDEGRPTYVTSGLRLDALTERYGEAVVRRIVEAGGRPGKVIDLWPR